MVNSVSADPAEKRQIYSQFRESFLTQLADVQMADNVKQEFQTGIRSRRSFHRISSYEALIQELEKQLIIFPEHGLVNAFEIILQKIQPPRKSLETELSRLQQQLQPRNPQPPLPTGGRQFPVPEEIVRLMAETFDEEKGRAWEHFATGLGWNRSERDLIRIRQGEVDRIEEHHSTTSERLRAVLTLFHSRCLGVQANIDLVNHIVEICKAKYIFGTPYNKLAKRIERLANN